MRIKRLHFCLSLLPVFVILSLLIVTPIPVAANPSNADSFIWSNYRWRVSVGEGPHGTLLDQKNVWVDQAGILHLKISFDGQKWTCAQIESVDKFFYGTYTFYVDARIDRLDKNTVLGMWSWGGYATDGLDEIDIEVAKWGNDNYLPGNYSVYPPAEHPELNRQKESKTFPISLNGTYTTHQYIWTEKNITFGSFHGHTTNPANRLNEDAEFNFDRPDDYQMKIPQKPLNVLFNYWLFQNTPPTDTNNLEIKIVKFTYQK